MAPIFTLTRVLCLLAFTKMTIQVDIMLEWWSETNEYWNNLVTVRCNNMPPGVCCKPRPETIPALLDNRAGGTTFYHLRQNQFGAGWAAQSSFPDPAAITCTGSPILRVHGPSGGSDDDINIYNPPWGDDTIAGTPETIVYAAAWIDLRLRFPPNSAETRYLQWQGVRGAVWGKDTWSAASGGYPFPRKKREVQKLNRYAQRGVATISTPTRWVYPDVYRVNGTDYRIYENRTYVSKDGKVLDLRGLRTR
ncbi:MAG: hypothetical protein Q9201_001690 [Fulgogasparrea decipioides]